MSTNTKKSKSSEETLEKLRAFINEKGGIVKKEEFAALDVDYRKILEFVEAGLKFFNAFILMQIIVYYFCFFRTCGFSTLG